MQTRRSFLHTFGRWSAMAGTIATAPVLLSANGCARQAAEDQEGSNLIFGKLGMSDGRFQKPRAIAIDDNDQLYIVDKTGRIQVFDSEGKFLRGWKTPETANGKPTGLSIDREGNLMVADTHYFRVLFYTVDGTPLPEKTLGGSFGPEQGQMAFVTDCVQTENGEYLVSEYGAYDRIQKYSRDGKFIDWFGEHGDAPNQFSRPQSLALDENGHLWIADSCNHRIQVYDWSENEPRLIKSFGSNGTEPGQFRYPYGIYLGVDCIYVAEYAGHRIQKLTRDGQFLSSWGKAGKKNGELNAPWSIVFDSKGRMYAVESGNHRVQRFVV